MTPGLERYARWLSRYFYVAGYEPEDLYQEAVIAIWRAPEGLERLCARRRVIELLRRSQRRPTFAALEDVASPADVVDLAAAREELRRILAVPLSNLEREALGRAARGEFCSGKRLDNALQRARKKVAA